jgi:hypothetical protein
MHELCRAFSRTLPITGNITAANMAMIAITVSSSTRLNPLRAQEPFLKIIALVSLCIRLHLQT